MTTRTSDTYVTDSSLTIFPASLHLDLHSEENKRPFKIVSPLAVGKPDLIPKQLKGKRKKELHPLQVLARSYKPPSVFQNCSILNKQQLSDVA